jgi:hypothetical protein
VSRLETLDLRRGRLAAALSLAGALVLALLPLLPLTLGGAWYLSAENAADATSEGRRWAVAEIAFGVAPFVAAIVVPVGVRLLTRSWGGAVVVTAGVVGVLTACAWLLAMSNAA